MNRFYQLENVISGRRFHLIFNTKDIRKIRTWASQNMDNFADELNEVHSCTVGVGVGNNTIVFRGDDDYVEFEVKQLTVVRL